MKILLLVLISSFTFATSVVKIDSEHVLGQGWESSTDRYIIDGTQDADSVIISVQYTEFTSGCSESGTSRVIANPSIEGYTLSIVRQLTQRVVVRPSTIDNGRVVPMPCSPMPVGVMMFSNVIVPISDDITIVDMPKDMRFLGLKLN